MRKTILASIFCFSAVCLAAGQTAAPSPSPTPDPEKEKADMILFLRDVDQDVSNLRLPENRIVFFAEIASVMWQFDETQARAIYGKASADLRQSLMNYANAVAQAKAAAAADPDALTSSFTGPYRDPFAADGRALRAVRDQLIASIAPNDLDLALSVLTDTASILSGVQDEYVSAGDDRLYALLAQQAAAKDPKRALAMALESLKKGLSSSHFAILQEINETDPESAKILGAAMLSAAKRSTERTYLLLDFLRTADSLLEDSKEPKGKPSPFTEAEVREIAGLVAADPEASLSFDLELVEKYLPAKAAALKAKANGVLGNANRISFGIAEGSASNANANAAVSEEEQRRKKRSEDSESLNKISKLLDGTLSKEEREKVLADAQKTIARIRDPRDKVMVLSAMAAGFAASDRPLALDLMRQADQIAPRYPRNYADFMVTFSVAAGYAMVDPEQAFPRIEALIAGSNEILNAGVRVLEFVDPEGSMFGDGEVKIGAFGGAAGSLVSGLSMFNVPLARLAAYDLTRTRALADRFDRPEARVLGKILILRVVATKFIPATVDQRSGPEKAETQLPDGVK
ncbi:MAG: hypothetical protein LC113_08960 [Acidobacteria bacterium]|nr:hypothetical protein [Acidobacteriota bacterium]